MKNSTDTIFELEILAQKTPAKIRINVQKLPKKCKNVQNLQKCSKTQQNCAKNDVKIQKKII